MAPFEPSWAIVRRSPAEGNGTDRLELERIKMNGVEQWCLNDLECEASRGGATQTAPDRGFFLPSQILDLAMKYGFCCGD